MLHSKCLSSCKGTAHLRRCFQLPCLIRPLVRWKFEVCWEFRNDVTKLYVLMKIITDVHFPAPAKPRRGLFWVKWMVRDASNITSGFLWEEWKRGAVVSFALCSDTCFLSQINMWHFTKYTKWRVIFIKYLTALTVTNTDHRAYFDKLRQMSMWLIKTIKHSEITGLLWMCRTGAHLCKIWVSLVTSNTLYPVLWQIFNSV